MNCGKNRSMIPRERQWEQGVPQGYCQKHTIFEAACQYFWRFA
ncbi:hypothetical protein BACCAP_02775 [Pseudoflavonifractor capillosus ATCC 29799]|uniref:Uncharacterized protein n=1 Tax=Pseudoflavonifractor capillosus ATCC 29799 TaxID=411467 RepID=A6NX30_9FIRM|nr:hypothetical protein BACCAP_02775 [Pseudoflavonifractor capillosus ATCC 29799]